MQSTMAKNLQEQKNEVNIPARYIEPLPEEDDAYDPDDTAEETAKFGISM